MRRSAAQRTVLEIGPHEAIAEYLDRAWPKHLPFTHFPSGEWRGDTITRVRPDGSTYEFSPTGARLKRMGLKKGWLDWQFVLPNGQFASAEVKRPVGGKYSDEQIEHRRKLVSLGCAVGTWTCVEDCERDITRWLKAFNLAPTAIMVQRAGPLL